MYTTSTTITSTSTFVSRIIQQQRQFCHQQHPTPSSKLGTSTNTFVSQLLSPEEGL
jgi:hypothetical protein